uniref:Uncharacterized protein n=1 Tax=Moniliophthora roreri TaxID=221103 RepID=A0A0W0FTP3_MONRR
MLLEMAFNICTYYYLNWGFLS